MTCVAWRRALACLALLPCLVWQAQAQPEEYELGSHYTELAHPLADRDPERIEVTELFWYGCPRCYDLLPTLQLWEASYRSADMDFYRLPVVWNKAMESHARAYLTADALGLLPIVNKSAWEVVPSIHNAFFDDIQAGHRGLRSTSDMAPLVEAWGGAAADFESTWHSDAIADELAELKSLPAFTEVPSLPALVVHGRYLITFNEFVPDDEQLFKVLNYLIAKVRKER